MAEVTTPVADSGPSRGSKSSRRKKARQHSRDNSLDSVITKDQKTHVVLERSNLAKSEPLVERKPQRPRSSSDPRREVKPTLFEARPSLFETLHEGSGIRTSPFNGFLNLAIIGGLFYVCTSNARAMFYSGTLVGLKTLRQLIPLEMIPVWGLMVAFSFLVVVIQKMKLNGWPNSIVWSLYLLMQTILAFGSVAYLWLGDYPAIPTGVFLAEALIIWMKVHSYFITNRQLRKEHTARQIRTGKNNASEPSASEMRAMERRGSISLLDAWLVYPHNVTFGNFFYFLCVPTLVYELNYPRTAKIRPEYIVEKCVLCLGIFSVLHVLVNQYIYPVLVQMKSITLLEAILATIVPFMFAYVLVFFIMFDVICNGFAEVTRFSDRRFYSDWWNSTTWDEFARKWNQPVHEWLLRHVYIESLRKFGRERRFTATFVTFLISSIVHELVLTVMSGIFKPFMFVLQMTQVPLIYFGRKLKGTRAGNMVFWASMLLGPPLLCTLYCREYMLHLSDDKIQAMASVLLDSHNELCLCASRAF